MGGGEDLCVVDEFSPWYGAQDCGAVELGENEEKGDVWTILSSPSVQTQDTAIAVSVSADVIEVECVSTPLECASKADLGHDTASSGINLVEPESDAAYDTNVILPSESVRTEAKMQMRGCVDRDEEIRIGCSQDGHVTSSDPKLVPAKLEHACVGGVETRLYNLMQVKADRVDATFVEKLLVSPDQIVELCKGILENSASYQDATINLDFDSLNGAALHVVGLYGSKVVLISMLERLKLLDETLARLMTSDGLETGLYGIHHGRTFYVFYWHHGQCLQPASKQCCNFIRYVADLCETVYVCLDASALDASHLSIAEAMKLKRKQRTQRLQVAIVKDSENALSLHPGFDVHPKLPGYAHDGTPVMLKLCEGRQRAALLYSLFHPSRQIHRIASMTVKTEKLREVVRDWLTNNNVDISRLSKHELSLFLQHAGLPESIDYCKLLKEANSRRAADQHLAGEVGTLVQEQQQLIGDILVSCVEAYRVVHYVDEEKGLKLSSLQKREENADGDVTSLQGPHPWGEYTASDFLDNASVQLFDAWAGSEKHPDATELPSALVFLGSEVIVESVDASPPPLWAEGKVFVVEAANGSRAGPVLLSQDFVLSNRDENISHRVVVAALEGDCPVGPVPTSQSLRCNLRRGEDNSSHVVQLKVVGHSGIVKWIKASINIDVSNLLERSKKLAYLTSGVDDVPRAVSEALVLEAQEILDSADALNLFNQHFPDERLSELLQNTAFESQAHYAFVGVEAREAVRAVYTRAWFDTNVRLMRAAKKFILPSLRARMQFLKQQSTSSLLKSLDEEEAKFLDTVDKVKLCSQAGRPSLTVTTCSPARKTDVGKYAQKRGLVSLALEYTCEVTLPERITWNVIELTPMKKDLDKLTVKDEVIVPKCSPPTKLINLDASCETVLLVVLIKTGEVLVVVKDKNDSTVSVYVTRKMGSEITPANLVKSFKRGYDLVAYDECLECLALYDKTSSKISIFRFCDSYRKLHWVDHDLLLSEYTGSTNLTALMFIPDKRALILIDDALKVRVLEFEGATVIRPRAICLRRPFALAKVSLDGSCLLVFHGPGSLDADAAGPEDVSSLDVYFLDDSMANLNSIPLEHSMLGTARIDAAVVAFGAQLHLILLDTSDPAKGLQSHIMKISVTAEVRRLQKVGKVRSREPETPVAIQATCPELEYVYQIFDKYSTSPPLVGRVRDFHLHVVLGGDGPESETDGLRKKCEVCVTSLMNRLETEEGKSFSKLKFSVASDTVAHYVAGNELKDSLGPRNLMVMGDWIRLLICLVPIQIARAENNTLTPLIDGLQMSSNQDYDDAVSLSNSLRFGLYDSVLENWRQPVKVISSMGKQSSGKSYLLNHLSGSILDVAGGRCTDGIWMTMRPSPGCLYVLLDFEGLGSFERSDQEDVLLSVLNAAVSNITIFNKKDFNLDKDTEALFQRFQKAVSLVKADTRFFKGVFYIAIKDVVLSDVDELKDEFIQKIDLLQGKAEESFLTKMYGSGLVVAAMSPIQRSEYHENVQEIAEEVEDLQTGFPSGRHFSADLKLITAQISTRDWSPSDVKREALKLDLLRKHVRTAINLGTLSKDIPLTNLDTDEAVPDMPVNIDGHIFDIPDAGLELFTDSDQQAHSGSTIQTLRPEFETVWERSGERNEEWHQRFNNFLLLLANRRRSRVLDWLACNTAEFALNSDVQNLRLEAASTLAGLKQSLTLCSCKCKDCLLYCVLGKAHFGGHSCMGSHVCAKSCTYCIQEGCEEQKPCTHPSGHDGAHDCKIRTHCCGMECRFKGQSQNCAHACALKPDHVGEHRCNTSHHLCGEKCSLPYCVNVCDIALDSDHNRHHCREKMCPITCSMEGCTRTCGSSDHFHALESDKHLCDQEHACNAPCAARGWCNIHTEVIHNQTFNGKRSCFEIEQVSEQHGVRKTCCFPIPAGEEQHEGPHCHSTNLNVPHGCEERCKACGYLCHLEIGHRGKHDTTHGNMRNVMFASEKEEIELSGRQYAWGDSGVAELCMLVCEKQGRGHIHLAKCEPNAFGTCQRQYKGARHERSPYGPDFHVAKDELTHQAYWEELGFKDPCPEKHRLEFELCNHYCRSEEHPDTSDGRSFCSQPMWHLPVAKGALTSGYVTEDGHVFDCKHAASCVQHIIFVIDKSRSMGRCDIFPTLRLLETTHCNRLGAVFEAIYNFLQTRRRAAYKKGADQDIVSIVLFDDNTDIVAQTSENKPETLLQLLLQKIPRYGTNYASGLLGASDVLNCTVLGRRREANSAPVIIFFSDGRNGNRSVNPIEAVQQMMKDHPRLMVHTLLFGSRTDMQTLQAMAAAGNGTFSLSLDDVQLARSFERLAHSLRPHVASLIES